MFLESMVCGPLVGPFAVQEVYAVLQDFTPGYGKLFISGLYTSGVYMVRITDAKGNVYQGKIVVR